MEQNAVNSLHSSFCYQRHQAFCYNLLNVVEIIFSGGRR